MKYKTIATLVTSVGLLAASTSAIFAHAVVKPNQAGVGSFTDFSVSVPSEKDASTVSVRLALPPGLNFVSPVVKPGWRVEVKQGPIPAGMQAPVAADGDVATAIPSEIVWIGGTIPAGQKDMFLFSAQVPAKATDLDWKVYQGYSDGSTVSWDQNPKAAQPKDDKGRSDFSKVGPFSVTRVVDDLTKASPDTGMAAPVVTQASRDTMGTWVAYLALVVALAALGLALNLRRSTKAMNG